MSASFSDYTTFDDTDVALNLQWPVMARCVQALGAYFSAKISTGTEPVDALAGLYLAVDGQSTTFKDWRIFVNSSNGFFIQENTGTDAVPVWTDRLSLPLGGGLVSPHASTHKDGGSDEVSTSTPGASQILKALPSGQIATGWLTGVIRNAEVSASAAIAYSKLALTGSIVNADVANAAAIAYSKLALTGSILNADIVAAAGIPYSKLTLTGSLVNADVANAAAIALNKLAALTASRVPVLDASGFLSASGVTSTTLGFLDATSSIQTQLDSKMGLTGGTVAAGLTTITYVDAGALAGPSLTLFRDSASPAANDELAEVVFASRDSANNQQTYGRITSRIDVATSAAETGQLRFLVFSGGTETLIAQAKSTGWRLPYTTASRAIYVDANKDIQVSATTDTELGYLSGVTSAIQTQLNAAQSKLVLLNSYSPSSAASVDITSQIGASYDVYIIDYALRCATDGANLYLRTDTSNGASFDSGANDYIHHGVSVSATNTVAGFGQANTVGTAILLSGLNASGIGNATNEGIAGRAIISFLGSASQYPVILWQSGFLDTGTLQVSYNGSGSRASAAAINAVQLLFSSGNIASGTVRFYGVKNS